MHTISLDSADRSLPLFACCALLVPQSKRGSGLQSCCSNSRATTGGLHYRENSLQIGAAGAGPRPDLGSELTGRLQARAQELQARAAVLAADGAQGPPARAHSPGETVWAREKGWPAWPAVVVTAQDTAACPALKGKRVPLLASLE